MKKILFGVALGALAMYLLDPIGGSSRRVRLSQLLERNKPKDTVLESSRRASEEFADATPAVAGVVGVVAVPSADDRSNGNALAAGAAAQGSTEG